MTNHRYSRSWVQTPRALRSTCGLLFLAACFITTTAQADPAGASRFEVGLQLEFVTQSESSNERTGTAKQRVMFLDQNTDGDFVVAVDVESSYSGHGDNRAFALLTLDLNGRVTDVEYKDRRFSLSHFQIFFPPLPVDDTTSWEWSYEDEPTSVQYHWQDEAEGQAIAFETEGIWRQIYDATHTGTVTLDPETSLPTAAESESFWGNGFNTTTRYTTLINTLDPLDQDKREQLHADFLAYTNLHAEIKEQWKVLGDDPKALDDVLSVIHTLCEEAEVVIAYPPLLEAVRREFGNAVDLSKYQVEDAERAAKATHRPAPLFKLKDLEGQSHSLKDLRGNVVVLDFWYRGCGWCVVAMPQINQLVEYFEGRPVVVLGMNSDRNLDDALFVQNEMQLRYKSLQATGQADKYGVRGFPTLVIIDQNGNIADYHVGYSKTLFEEVSQQIEHLLEHPPAKTSQRSNRKDQSRRPQRIGAHRR